MPTLIGLTCLSASSTKCVWWCADARTALLHSVWRYIGHQSLRPHHGSIFVRLPPATVLPQRRTTYMYGGRAFAVAGPSTWNSLPKRLRDPSSSSAVLPVFWKHSSSQSTSLFSAIEALAIMWYINLRFYSAPHCKCCTSYSNSVCLSVCPTVRLSHAGIVSKRRHIARCSLHCRIEKMCLFSRNKFIWLV